MEGVMEKQTRTIELVLDDVKVTVEYPATLPEPAGVNVRFNPESPKVFEQIAAAVGGVESLSMPKTMGGYYDEPAFARPGEGRLGVTIYPPPKATIGEPDAGPRPHPFFGRYAPGEN